MTLYIIFSLDAQRSQSVASAICQCNTIHWHKWLLKWKYIHIMRFSVAYWDTWNDNFAFSMQGEDIIKHTDGKHHMFII